MSTEIDLAWLAGLLEGEGYFGTINNRVSGKIYRYPRIGVAMTDRDVIEKVAALWGTKIQTLKPRGVSKLTSYRITLVGSRALEWMKLVLPYMGSRRTDQIENAIIEWESLPSTTERRRKSCQDAVKKHTRLTNGTFAAYE